ncbi:MAG: SDR family NAD(P)-dependent oxidoreductase [Rhodospirillaceae bacterium]|nr:SDR family NAD(P)-dependent oxidoreductase [Rhodospirillaceae bacterium]
MTSVVITGSTKGIGHGYAREFLKRGYNVCVTGRNATEVSHAVESLGKDAPAGARVMGVPCDIAAIAQVQAVWDQAAAAFGKVDIWVNNAGFARSGVTLLQHTPAEMKSMVESNVIGTINATQVAVRGMQKQGHGHIFNTLGGGSDGRVYPGMIGYSTTKRAVKYFTECLIKELGPGPVRVGMISPGVNISEGMIREMLALPASERKKAMWTINVMGDYVETTTPWLVDQMLDAVAKGAQGRKIAWMTGGKIMGRFLMAPFKKRDLFARFGLSAA